MYPIRLVSFPALFFASSLQAAITSAEVIPSNVAVPVGQAASASLRWAVVRGTSPTGLVQAGENVVSGRGEFRDAAGQLLGRVERRLQQTRTVSSSDTFTFRETVRVPAALLYQAHKAGLTHIYYQRTFDDDYGAQSASAEMRLTSAAAAGFSLSRLALSFEGGWLHRVVAAGEVLRPQVVVSFSGSGQFRATWEVAEPATTRGEPVFRPLISVRRYLTAGGETLIEGPVLPTRSKGTYLLRLRIDAPDVGFAPPLLRYVVEPAAARALPTLTAQSPLSGARLTAVTRFQWSPVAGARAYQVEIRGTESVTGPPLTGLVATAEQNHVVLPPHTRERLKPGRYYWRLLAIGPQGGVLAASPLRELRVIAP